MNARLIPSLCAFAVAAPAALGQGTPLDSFDPNAHLEPGTPVSDYFRVQEAFSDWKEQNGEEWLIRYDSRTRNARFLYGGSARPAFRPSSDSDYVALAREAILESQGILGIELGTLVEDYVMFLPLGNAGSTDKMTVRFHQEYDGVPVIHGYVNVLFALDGTLLSVDRTGLPNFRSFDVTPGYGANEAMDATAALFEQDTGLPATEVTPAELLIDQVESGKYLEPKLVWKSTAWFRGPGMQDEGWTYRLDAETGAVVSRDTAIHTCFDVGGVVRSMATPGPGPDEPGNPEVATPMPYINVNTNQGNTVTDVNGNYNVVGASFPLQVTLDYSGTYCDTVNQAGADYSLTTTLNALGGGDVLMNPTSNASATGEANALNWIGLMRQWTRTVNPADASNDFLATANVNIAATCNAFYNGSSVNFYPNGGGCVNTSYSSVVLHEMGHWMNDIYSSGNGSDGFGEGNADNFSTFILDYPLVGENFCGAGCHVRDANNNRQFCGDTNPGCHGGVHANGEVLMGAFWNWRTNLKATHGASAGSMIADTLLNSWMNAFDDGNINTIVEDHILTVDDDNGNIGDGTPNYGDIDPGFRDQGFPGVDLDLVTITNVTVLPANTQNESGPYTVNADVQALVAPPLTTVDVKYTINGGVVNSVAMSSTGGNGFTGDIPGITAPATVVYWVEGEDSASNVEVSPTNQFTVGVLNIYAQDLFESGTNGWTTGVVPGASNTQNDWQLSSNVGLSGSGAKSGDPADAFSGSNIWGNDLGPTGWNGAYQDNIHNFLRSPVFDLTGATNVHLRFKRWLTCEAGNFDQARVLVNGTQVWINQLDADTIDTSWVDMDIDVSALADNNPSVQLEFQMETDGGTVFGGWNIDDVELSSLTGTGSCATPTNYCTAKMTSSGLVPFAASSGTPALSVNDFIIELHDAEPLKNGIMFWGTQTHAAPFFGGTLCVKPPVNRTPVISTDITGFASRAFPIDASMVGQDLKFQWWFRDPLDLQTVGLSDGLSATICN